MTPGEQRRCDRCGDLKSLTEFDFRTKGGWQGYCRPCHKAYKEENYRRNKEKFIARALAHKERLRQLVRSAKDRPCADCEGRYPHYVMDFDHRQGEEKLFNIADLASKRWVSVDSLGAEIAKCDVVCANCHRERTHRRREAEVVETSGIGG